MPGRIPIERMSTAEKQRGIHEAMFRYNRGFDMLLKDPAQYGGAENAAVARMETPVMKDGSQERESYFDYTNRQFGTILYYLGMKQERGSSFTREDVDKVISNTLIDGQSYGERYNIQVTDANYTMVAAHLINNLTEGEIAQSFRTKEPKNLTIVGTQHQMETRSKVVYGVCPPRPEEVEQPRLSGWKKFWSNFGFYKKERGIYDSAMERYNKSQEEIKNYGDNVRGIDAVAFRQQRDPNGLARQRVYEEDRRIIEERQRQRQESNFNDLSKEEVSKTQTEHSKQTAATATPKVKAPASSPKKEAREM